MVKCRIWYYYEEPDYGLQYSYTEISLTPRNSNYLEIIERIGKLFINVVNSTGEYPVIDKIELIKEDNDLDIEPQRVKLMLIAYLDRLKEKVVVKK